MALYKQRGVGESDAVFKQEPFWANVYTGMAVIGLLG